MKQALFSLYLLIFLTLLGTNPLYSQIGSTITGIYGAVNEGNTAGVPLPATVDYDTIYINWTSYNGNDVNSLPWNNAKVNDLYTPPPATILSNVYSVKGDTLGPLTRTSGVDSNTISWFGNDDYSYSAWPQAVSNRGIITENALDTLSFNLAGFESNQEVTFRIFGGGPYNDYADIQAVTIGDSTNFIEGLYQQNSTTLLLAYGTADASGNLSFSISDPVFPGTQAYMKGMEIITSFVEDTTSPPPPVVVSCEEVPVVNITSPSNNQNIILNTTISGTVTASDDDGIDSVVFFIDDVQMAVDLSSPFSYTLPTSTTGTYEFKAVAYDTCLSYNSDSINFNVVEEGDPIYSNADFCEQNGLVVIDPENLTLPSGWQVGTTEANYSGNGYIYYDSGDWSSSWYNNPGNKTISISIEITNPGTYEFKWRNQAGGTDRTEENDTWLRFPDADDFFAIKNGTQLFKPVPDCSLDPNANCPQGASNNGWFKVYVNNLNWQWFAGTSDNGPATEIFATFNTPGTYTLEISARSKDHFIDKIVMYDNVNTNEFTALNTALAETECASGPVPACALVPLVNITSPTSGTILSQNSSSTAQITATDNDGIDSVTFFIDDIRQSVDTTSPYTYSLPTSTTGTYEFKAVAYDTCGQSNADSINYTVFASGGGSGEAPNFPGGRIALLHDGNQADADDIGAMPMMFFQAYYAGLIDTIVWCGYSNLAGSGCRTTFTTNGNGTFNNWCEMMDSSAAWAQSVLGANPSIFHDINEEYNAASFPNQYDKIPALDSLVTQINASSASNPLWILAGAPHDIIWRALRDANPSKHQYVWIISHSSWNETSTYGGNQYTFKNIQNSYPNVNMVGGCTNNFTNPCLEDQNHSVADGAPDADFRDESGGTSWNWMYSNQQGNAISDWLRKQNVDAFFINKNGATVDWSDAGMMWYLLSGGPNGGDQQGTSSKVKYLFDNGQMP